MAIVRKGKIGENEKIVNTANGAFIPERPLGYDFKKSMPKIYASTTDYSTSHFIVEEDEKFLAVAGNLFVSLDNSENKFSLLGTVSTLPEHQGKGYMKMMMKAVDEEDKQKGSVASILTGRRHRYAYFGYTKIGYSYKFSFEDNFVKYVALHEDINIREINENDTNKMFDLYAKNSPIILRNRADFIHYLKTKNCNVFVVEKDNEFLGYFSISLEKKKIYEFFLNSYDCLAEIVSRIISLFGYAPEFLISSLLPETIQAFDKICEEKSAYDTIRVRVYRLREFLESVLNINLKFKKIQDVKECIIINEKSYEITIKDNKASVLEFDSKDFGISLDNFLNQAFTFDSRYKTNIFPLIFDMLPLDLF